ncbi:MAG: cyclic nucleotide-binding domain-containing protein [Treponema sp.]|jgi:CRP-like cAMP-binding protein|nr:cyclic nucleotide-binding domain-containing protein [Treponema sp.]
MVSAPQLSLVNFRKDMYILIEGKRDEARFFVIREGFVKITRSVQIPAEDSQYVVGPGDFIGVVSSMSQRSQIETAQAVTDVTLLAVQRSQFEGLIQFNTPVAIKIIQQFARRMRFLNNALSAFSSPTKTKTGSKNKDDTYEDMSGSLFLTGEYYHKLNMLQQARYIYSRYTECYPLGEYAKQAEERAKTLIASKADSYEVGADKFIRFYRKNALVFAEGEFGQELYVLQKGAIKIIKVFKGKEVILAILKPGEIFGEMAILDDKPRSASAVVMEGTVLMVLLKQNFESMAKQNPQIIARVTRMLSERIWFSDKQLTNAMIKNPLGRVYNYLEITLEKENVEQSKGNSHVFNFGTNELMKMAFIPPNDHKYITNQLLDNSRVVGLYEGKIFAKNVDEVFKLGGYYRKMQEREDAKKH